MTHVERALTTTLLVPNPIGFAADAGRHALELAREKYVGKCFQGMNIRAVKAVLRRSRLELDGNASTGQGHIQVELLVDAVIFALFDIIVAARIERSASSVVGVYARDGVKATVVVSPDTPAARVVAPGQLLPVRILKVEHKPGDVAAIVATPLACDRATPVFAVRRPLDPARARATLEPLLRTVEAELELRARLVASRRDELWFFERLLVAVRPPKNDTPVRTGAWEGPAWADGAGATSDIVAIVRSVCDDRKTEVVEGYWTRPFQLYRSSPLAVMAIEPPPGHAVEMEPEIAFAHMLKNIADFLRATRELVETYSTPELVATHENIWATMRNLQRIA
jgi:hypothetical protein